MNRFAFFLIYISLLSGFFLIGKITTNLVWAQHNSSEELLNQETPEINQEIENLGERQIQEQTLEQKEEKLEQELQIHQEGLRNE